MQKEKILRSSLFLSIGVSILASWFKLMHKPGSDFLFFIALIAAAVFIITAIGEINRSEKIEPSEKIMWVFGFLFLTGIAGLVYIFSGRKRVV
jgi:peptidoglycan/LPS O-acetylase OafA/YrhL